MLHSAVASVVRTFNKHRRSGPFLAAMLLLDPVTLAWRGGGGDALVEWLADQKHESHLAWRAAIKGAPGAVARRRAWQHLGRGAADRACLNRLASAPSAAEHAAVLELWHLVINPDRGRRFAASQQRGAAALAGTHPLPAAHHLEQLSPAARRATAHLTAVVEPDRTKRARVFDAIASDADPSVRLAAMVAAQPDHDVALRFCTDTDLHIARFAGIVAGDAAEVDPWSAGCEHSRLEALRLLRLDRSGFLAQLRARIEDGSEAQRLDGILLAKRLGLGGELEIELLRALARDDGTEGRLTATAVSALGDVPSGAAASAVKACVGHPVGRVRANAVEVMLSPKWGSHGHAQWAASLLELKTDRHHRVRSTLLRGVLTAAGAPLAAARSSARLELMTMIGDERPLHRLAGLWAIERAISAGSRASVFQPHWNEVASRIAQLTGREPEAAVRERAAKCARLMLAQVRVEWRRRAADALQEAAA
jgi:hypothetical protein